MAMNSRRLFLGTSFSTLGAGSFLLAQEPKEKTPDWFTRKLVPEDPAFQPNTLFLTWHKDPTTTMVIQWIGVRGETSDTTITYTADKAAWYAPQKSEKDKTTDPKSNPWKSQKPDSKPYPRTDFQVFRAELTGLTPGTEYAFRIGKSSGTYRFRTMPAKLTDTFTFVSGGDVGVNSAAIANNLMAARQNPYFAIVGGDLGYDNGRSVEISIAFIRNWSRTMIDMEGRLIPMVTCIGNHEVDGGFSTDRAKSPFYLALFDGIFPQTTFNTLDFGDYLSLVLLDTGHLTSVEGEQTHWLEKTLKTRENLPHTLVVNHVPAYPSHRNPLPSPSKDPNKPNPGTGEASRKHWVPLFEKYRVPLVLEHHDHTFKRTKPLINGMENSNGVLYLGDGSWGRLRIPRPTDDLHVMVKTSADYHITLHRIQGNQRFHMAMDEKGRVMDSSSSGQRRKGLVAVNG